MDNHSLDLLGAQRAMLMAARLHVELDEDLRKSPVRDADDRRQVRGVPVTSRQNQAAQLTAA